MRQNSTNVSLQSFFDLSVQTLSILRDMHAADLIHCDLKPANIVVKAGKTPVIIDFGPIKNRSEIDAQSFVMHTPRFSAPEISDLPAHVSQWSDIYWLFASRDFDRDQVAANGLALPKFEGLPDSFTAELQACFAKGLLPPFQRPLPRCDDAIAALRGLRAAVGAAMDAVDPGARYYLAREQ